MTRPAGGPPPERDGWQAVAVTALDVGVLVIDGDGIRHVNPAAEMLLGVPAEELVGRQPDDAPLRVFDESGGEVSAEERAAARMTRDVDEPTVTRVINEHGAERWLRAQRTVFELDGRPALLVTLTDVSAQKHAEEASRRAADRLQQILDAVDASVFVKDQDGRYLFVNAAFEREIGRPRQDLLGRRTSEVSPDPEAARAAEVQDARVLETGEPVSDLLQLGDRTYLTSKAPLRGVDDAVDAIVGTSTNLTAQVRAAEAEAIAAAVVQSATDGIVTFDRDARVTGINEVATGGDAELASAVIGRPAADAFPLGSHVEDARHLLAAVLAGEHIECESIAADGVGDRRVLRLRLFPIRGADGDVVGGAIMGQDITDLRGAEQERLRMQRELEHVERLDSLGQLAGGVAHDFNNSLAAIKLTAEMLVSSLPHGSEDQEQAKRILAVTERASELTGAMLVFARKENTAHQRVDVNQVVQQADVLLARTLGEHIERRLVLTEVPCVVDGDPARIEQVVINLAVNARDAMPDGGRLLVETEVRELDEVDQEAFRARTSGPHVVLSVTDQGSGMDAETARQAFEPFFTTKPRGRGTGLGLATVYAVADQAGGGTWIYSEPGRGTVVKVALPLAQAADDAAERSEQAKPVPASAGRRVFVAEDEAALRDVARRLLARAGYEVEVFPDGAELIAALPRLGTPDVLVTDVVMPGLSGPDLAARVRQVDPRVRIVFMSGYTAGLMDEQVDGEVLAKPFSSATLVAAVERALEKA